jgi:hypothetical protein
MKTSEIFLQIGWLPLNKEQSAQISAEFGKNIDAVPLYNVVAIGAADRYLPVSGVPGLAGIVIHYGSAAEPGSQVIASVLEEMARDADEGRVFAAHTKLMAPRNAEESKAAEAAKAKAK